MVEKVEELKVEKLKVETKIKNEAPVNNSNCSTSQPLNRSTSDGVAIRVDYLFTFEKLEVWQLAKKLCISVYGISNKFPSNVLHGLFLNIDALLLFNFR